MRSRASASALLLLASCATSVGQAPPIVAAPPPPEQLYDDVGYAGRLDDGSRAGAIIAAHRTLPPGSVMEVTALDTGRTALVLVENPGPADRTRIIDLSRGAALLLGIDREPVAPVRVRSVVTSPADRAALLAGQAAATRLDAPPPVLAALRRRLSGAPAPNLPLTATPLELPPPSTDRRGPGRIVLPAAPPAKASGTYFVQVAAFSSQDRARGVAGRLHGQVDAVRTLWRVRLGPFATSAAAQRARDDAVRAGYGDARIVRSD